MWVIKDIYTPERIRYVDADSPSMQDFIITEHPRTKWPDMNYKKFADREEAKRWADHILRTTKQKFLIHEI